jgi:hypothetical protein
MKPSELKKLAKVCREAGIKNYKTSEFEFTLSDDMPTYVVKTKTERLSDVELAKPIESDDLSQEALLFWSSGEDFTQESKEN